MDRSRLPDGTVTFLFTDIEGSTKLLHELGAEAYAEALDAHRRVLRQAFVRHDGIEVDTQGDAFFVAFPTAPGALEAAREAQDALEIPVRMGIHTGTPLLADEGYVGVDVHKAARIAAAGHGRQVLVSSASAALLEGDGLRDLGEHRLKDLSAPERIYQLGGHDFPPLKTLYRTNLPIPATQFLGRERELTELGEFLDRSDVRLLTLLGPGGTGKTRLALQAAAAVADHYPDGVFWVALAPLRDPALVLESASKAIGAENGLADHVADKRLLLVLDNFEHLIGAADRLGPLLASCPNLTLVVTSRELLQLAGEQSYPVPPLDPEDGVELFVARARAFDPAFEPDEVVATVCDRLDNLPLAVELAAARLRSLTPRQLLDRLAQRLDLLKGGRDSEARQQTLRATIEWSHDLLAADEQRLFARLAVFRGGCTLEAAEAVADADLDTLQSLVDKSLLRHTGERFWMLETIREYAGERLDACGEGEELRRRHALCVLEIAEAAHYPMEEGKADQAESLARIDAEHDNLRTALEWAREEDEDEILLRLSASLSGFWGARAFRQEAETWLPLAYECGSEPQRARFEILRSLTALALDRGDTDAADAFVDERRRIAERAGDDDMLLAVLGAEGRNAQYKGDFEGAAEAFRAFVKIARERENLGDVAIGTVNLATVANDLGDLQAALDYAAESLALFRQVGDDGGVVVALLNIGLNAFPLGDHERAARAFREALSISAGIGFPRHVYRSAVGLGAALVAGGKPEWGVWLLGAASALQEEREFALEPELEVFLTRAVPEAKAALGEEAYAAAWARGQAMTPEEIGALTMPG